MHVILKHNITVHSPRAKGSGLLQSTWLNISQKLQHWIRFLSGQLVEDSFSCIMRHELKDFWIVARQHEFNDRKGQSRPKLYQFGNTIPRHDQECKSCKDRPLSSSTSILGYTHTVVWIAIGTKYLHLLVRSQRRRKETERDGKKRRESQVSFHSKTRVTAASNSKA